MSAIKKNTSEINDVITNEMHDRLATYSLTKNRCREAVLELIENNSGYIEGDYANQRDFVYAAGDTYLSTLNYQLGTNGISLLSDDAKPLLLSPITILYHRDGQYIEIVLVDFDGNDLITYDHSCCALGLPLESAEEIQHELFFAVIDQLIELGVMKNNDVPSLYLLEYVWSCIAAPSNNLLQYSQLDIPPRVSFVNPDDMSQLNEQFEHEDAA
jgi:hypothetical protein